MQARSTMLGLAVAAAALIGGPAGWVVTDALEQDNDFCNACHLSAEVPLHIDIRQRFDGRPPVDLAGLHASVGAHDKRPEAPDFRCIDCHGGVGLVGKARVKALAAKDAFFWLVGRFEEPSEMRWPLWDDDCRQCHASFARKAVEEWEDPYFHDLPLHNAELGVACVDCHLSHRAKPDPRARAKPDPDAYFLDSAHVRSRCVRCHPEFEGGY